MVSTVGSTTADADAGVMLFEETLTADGPGVWDAKTLDLTQFAGNLIWITFRHYDSSDWFRINIDDVKIIEPASDDLAVDAIVSPSNDGGCTFTNEEYPTVRLFNFGGNTLSSYEVSYSINGGDAVTEMVTEDITSANSIDYTFTTPFDASELGEYEISVSATLTGDTNAGNNELTGMFRHTDDVLTVRVVTDASGGQAWELIDNTTNTAVATHGSYAWNLEFSDDVCIFSDRCYTFNYAGQMGAGATLQILLNGDYIGGDNSGAGVPANITLPAIGGGCAAEEVIVRSINSPRYHIVDNDVPVTLSIYNQGSSPITSLDMSYTVDGGAPVMETLSDLNIASGAETDVSFSTPISLTELADYDVEVNISQVNGVMDGNMDNNSASTIFATLPFAPNKHVISEEATGTWCPWCPRGAVMMDMMVEKYEGFIGIAVHNADPMVVSEYDTGLGTLIGGYPQIIFDRLPGNVLPNDLASFPEIEADYQERLAILSPVDVEITASVEGDLLTMDVATSFLAGVAGESRLAIVITEDGVTGTGADWAQANNYAGGQVGPMAGYENLPSPVPADQMVYDHVARAILGGFNGSSLGTDIARGTDLDNTVTWTIPQGSEASKLYAIAMIIGPSGAVLNSTYVSDFAPEPNSAKDLTLNENLAKVYPNPSSGEVNVELNLATGSDVNMTVVNTMGQTVAQRNYGELVGKQILPIEGSNFENGMYFINLTIGNEFVTKKLTISK